MTSFHCSGRAGTPLNMFIFDRRQICCTDGHGNEVHNRNLTVGGRRLSCLTFPKSAADFPTAFCLKEIVCRAAVCGRGSKTLLWFVKIGQSQCEFEYHITPFSIVICQLKPCNSFLTLWTNLWDRKCSACRSLCRGRPPFPARAGECAALEKWSRGWKKGSTTLDCLNH